MNKNYVLFVLVSFLFCFNAKSQNIDTSGFSEDYTKFTNDQKQFNDWSVSIYGGFPWLQSSDLTSIDNGMSSKYRIGYEVQASINKQITHAFGISLAAQLGETHQGYGDELYLGKTKYIGLSLISDVNFSALARRIDNRSQFRWALHGYFGAGTLGYEAYLKDVSAGETSFRKTGEGDLGLKSFYGQVGAGVVYKINKRLDAGAKIMYIYTGDNKFDGSGDEGPISELHRSSKTDNFITTTFGVTYKVGKHNEYLSWIDPLREAFTKINNVAEAPQLEVCVFGDKDDDGVCDDWDRELDTPKGARVDGSGRALDTDMDGIIDLYDKCPTFPGPPSDDPEKNGCPEAKDVPVVVNDVIATMGGIQFNFDSDKILIESQPILDNVADVIKKYGENTRFIVEGHTDARGSVQYNINLSKKRVTSVIKYLVSKGVAPYQLIGKGLGFQNPKYPECTPASKCPEWKNRENRRVIFKLAD